MRIFIVLSAVGPGGAERVASLLGREWCRQGREVTLVSFDRCDARSYHALGPGVRVVHLKIANQPSSRISAAFRSVRRIVALRRLIRREAPDLVVSFLTKMNVLTLLACRGLRVPVVICERNNPLRQEAHPLWWSLHERLRKRATLVLQTRASLDAFAGRDLGRIRVIPNPLEPVAAIDRPESRTIVAVGRLVPQKGFDLLLRAFSRIADQRPDWSLLIWGEGPERERLTRDRDALGLKHRVSLPGVTVSPGAWMEVGSIFVLASRYEGFPNVLVEAMAAGFPVVSFDCPWGPAEIIEDGRDGLLVPVADEASLAHALKRLIDDPHLRSTLGDTARRNVQRFSAGRIFEQWEELIANVTEPATIRTGRKAPPAHETHADDRFFGAR